MVGKIQKRDESQFFQFRYRDQDGRWRWKSTKTANRGEAEAIRREFERTLLLEADRPEAEATSTLGSAVEAMLEDCRRHELSAGSLDMYDCKARHLVRLLGTGTDVNSLTLEDVNQYIDERVREGASHHTCHKELITLGKTLRLMRRMKRFHSDPDEILPEKFGQGYTPRKRPLTREDYAKLLPKIPKHRKTMFETVVALGLRKGEAERMRPEDIDLDLKQVLIRGTKTKRSWRTVPIGSEQKAILSRAIDEMPEGQELLFGRWRNMTRGLAHACDKAHVHVVSANDLRHTFATWRINMGFAPSTIGALMGHTDGKMVERVYGHLFAETLRAAMECGGRRRRDARKKESGCPTSGPSIRVQVRQECDMTETGKAGFLGSTGSRGSGKGEQDSPGICGP